jgi:hypothetical protein
MAALLKTYLTTPNADLYQNLPPLNKNASSEGKPSDEEWWKDIGSFLFQDDDTLAKPKPYGEVFNFFEEVPRPPFLTWKQVLMYSF